MIAANKHRTRSHVESKDTLIALLVRQDHATRFPTFGATRVGRRALFRSSRRVARRLHGRSRARLDEGRRHVARASPHGWPRLPCCSTCSTCSHHGPWWRRARARREAIARFRAHVHLPESTPATGRAGRSSFCRRASVRRKGAATSRGPHRLEDAGPSLQRRRVDVFEPPPGRHSR